MSTVTLGSFLVGEVPPPLTYQFLNDAGTAINLTGFGTAQFQWSAYVDGGVPINPTSESATVTDATTGTVTYVWDGDEFSSPGEHRGVFYVNNGTVQYASLVIIWYVCLGVGVPPTI